MFLIAFYLAGCGTFGAHERSVTDVLGVESPAGRTQLSCIYVPNADYTNARYFFHVTFPSEDEARTWVASLGLSAIVGDVSLVFSEMTSRERIARNACGWTPSPSLKSSDLVVGADTIGTANHAVVVVSGPDVWGSADTFY